MATTSLKTVIAAGYHALPRSTRVGDLVRLPYGARQVTEVRRDRVVFGVASELPLADIEALKRGALRFRPGTIIGYVEG